MANTENLFDLFGEGQDTALPTEVDFGDFTDIEDNSNPFEDVPELAEEKAATEGDKEVAAATEESAKAVPAQEKAEEPVEKSAEIKVVETKSETDAKEDKKADKPDAAPSDNPFEAEMNRIEEKQVEETKAGLLNQNPVFVFASAKDEIKDSSITFDALRKEKMEDFPELEDGKRVSWKMTYAGITKNVSNPEKTTIADQKKLIEDSKDFLNALKKSKTDMTCKVTPTVTAQKKGRIPDYIGFFTDMKTAAESDKAISYIPAEDGEIYEVRKNSIGIFTARADRVRGLSRIKAGFTPALPLFPFSELCKIIAFFKKYSDTKNGLEALVDVFWNPKTEEYVTVIPTQLIGKASVDAVIGEEYSDLVHVMDIHSHNTMEARFSGIDDKDEKATRIYVVIGRMDKFFPDVTARISVGGKFVEINPDEIFEYPFLSFPQHWGGDLTEGRAGRLHNGITGGDSDEV